MGHRRRSEGPDLQGALRTRLRDRLQSRRRTAGHGGADGTLRLWDVTARQDAVSIPKDGLFAVEFPELSPDGQTLLAGFAWGVRRPFRLWDAATGQPRCGPIELPLAPVSKAAWTADGRRLYLADAGKTMRVLDVASGKVVRTFPIDAEASLYRIALSPDEKWCRHPGPGRTIQVRECPDRRPLPHAPGTRRVPGGPGVQSGRLAPARSRSGRGDQDLEHRDRARDRGDRSDRRSAWVARFSADGNRLAVAGFSGQFATGEVRVLDAEDAREVWSLKGHTLPVLDVAFSPDGHRLATTSAGPYGPALGPDRGAGDPEAGQLAQCR